MVSMAERPRWKELWGSWREVGSCPTSSQATIAADACQEALLFLPRRILRVFRQEGLKRLGVPALAEFAHARGDLGTGLDQDRRQGQRVAVGVDEQIGQRRVVKAVACLQ